MIPVTEHDQEVISSGVSESTSFEISAEDTAHIMTILRDTLYSDKILAVIREYTSNAWDANRMAGRGDSPISVHFPTNQDQSFRVRDLGPGLSPDDIRRIFTKYGASTKRNSNEAVGMLGIGSKSGFAYSDSFTVTSWHGGRKRVYVAVIDASQKGRIDLLHEEDCGDEVGVEVEIPVQSHDIANFHNKGRTLLCYMDPLPATNLGPALSRPSEGEEVGDMGRVRTCGYYGDRGVWTAVMGCVPYRIDLDQLTTAVKGQQIGNAVRNLSGTVWFDIGQLQVAASREDLKYSDATKLALVKRLNDISDEYVRRKLDGIDKLNPWEKRKRARDLSNIGLPLPDGLRELAQGSVYVNERDHKPEVRLVTVDDYRKTMHDTSYIAIDDKLRFIIRDDKRTVKGFQFGPRDIVVTQHVTPKGTPRVELTPKQLRAGLDRLLGQLNLTGAPVALLSSVPWSQPSPKHHTPRDPAKARAAVLVYTGGGSDSRPSTYWTVEQHKVSDDDLYVVLDSYRVDGSDDFYDKLQEDFRILQGVGITPPKVIGYKRTKANPVDVSKLKGTEYRKWRADGGIAKMLAKVQEVMDCAQAQEYASFNSSYPYIDHAFIVKNLGKDHPISRFVEKVHSSRAGKSKYSSQVVYAAQKLRNEGKALLDASKERDMIVRSYPMFKTAHFNFLTGFAEADSRQLWVDYVNMADEHRVLLELSQETKVA